MLVDKLQRQRFEYKYLINEHIALAVRDFVSSYLTLDEFGATQPDNSYPVHSLYLDSPDLALYKSTINGDKNRYKLRIRFYENHEGGPAFFEIKRRSNNVISKKRAAVTRDAAHWILAGHLPEPSFLVNNDAFHRDAIENFCQLLNMLRARPQVHVSYLREAWMAEGSNSVRVTIDRRVKSERIRELKFSTEMMNPIRVFGDRVILELKFTDRFPNWFKDLVQIFGLRQGSAAKYVDGVFNMGERGIMSAYV